MNYEDEITEGIQQIDNDNYQKALELFNIAIENGYGNKAEELEKLKVYEENYLKLVEMIRI